MATQTNIIGLAATGQLPDRCQHQFIFSDQATSFLQKIVPGKIKTRSLAE